MTLGDAPSQGLGQSLVPVPEVTGKQPAYQEAWRTQRDTVTRTADVSSSQGVSSQPSCRAANPKHSLHLQGALESEDLCTAGWPCQALRFLEM